MAKISKQEVKKVARLARIRITDDEVERFGQQLSAVIDYNMELLAQADVTDVPPTAQTGGVVNVFDEDEPQPGLSQPEALSQAAHVESGQFKVLKVLTDS